MRNKLPREFAISYVAVEMQGISFNEINNLIIIQVGVTDRLSEKLLLARTYVCALCCWAQTHMHESSIFIR